MTDTTSRVWRMKLIEERRRDLGMTRQEAGSRAGMSPAAWYQYESGTCIPHKNALARMEFAVGLTVIAPAEPKIAGLDRALAAVLAHSWIADAKKKAGYK